MMKLDLQLFGGRGGKSRSGGGSKVKQSVATEAQNNIDSTMRSIINETKQPGRALTTLDERRLADALSAGAMEGDKISSREDNRWHNITDTFTKLDDGWQYVRKNEGTGDIYENRRVATLEVAQTVLDYQSQRWEYEKKKRQ